MICEICKSEFKDRKSLHVHIRFSEKIRLAAYYETHYPRKCLYSGQPIKYNDDADDYLDSIFLNRQNMVLYLQKVDKVTAKNMVINLLSSRKSKKGLIYAPSTSYCRSVLLPTPQLCDKIKVDYNKCCEFVGLTTLYDYKQKIQYYNMPRSELLILIDSRENFAWKFTGKSHITCLTVGDISVNNELMFKNLFIENKAGADFIHTMSQDLDRFKKELLRARDLGAYLIILCQQPFNKIQNIENTKYYSKFTKATGKWLLHNMCEIIQEFSDICQFCFYENSENVGRFVEDLFLLETDIRKMDIQYLLDKGILK